MTIGSVASQPSGELGSPAPTFPRLESAAPRRVEPALLEESARKAKSGTRRRPRLSLGRGSFHNFENAWVAAQDLEAAARHAAASSPQPRRKRSN